MSSPWRGRVRGARTGVLALVAVLLAAGAHVLGGGSVPGPARALALWLAVLPVAWLLTRRTWGPAPTTAALGLLELGLHHALGIAATGSTGGHGVRHLTSHGVHAAGSHGEALVAHGTAGHVAPGHVAAAHAALAHVSTAPADALHGGHPGTAMLLGHALATVLTALLLAHGDALLARVWARAALRGLPTTEAPVTVLRATPPPVWFVGTGRAPAVTAGGVCRRGPPRG